MKKKILVVDDNADNLLLERDLLEVFGFEVFEAENAVNGIDSAFRERPDIIVMDVRLPDMRGPEAAKLLRNHEETKDIPIVFVTASVMPAEKDELTSIENSWFIPKPIDTRTFAKDVSQFIK